ncbi:hypothetical protein M8998_07380 [Sphingobacterium sp. lm-10]|uniref:hypothetical protein n=1 Tax=Sphingobacterium sp. lm-10 TaxID=2944904 RepID=UPI00202158ED|nr:hypothetical protein [Sphingobacterium sp. lm-10]MCL7987756.1 hypothetical protein [Sphingobacterium sp. lm-10]
MAHKKVVVGNLHSEESPHTRRANGFQNAIDRYSRIQRHNLRNTFRNHVEDHRISDEEHEVIQFCKGFLVAVLIFGGFVTLAYQILKYTS